MVFKVLSHTSPPLIPVTTVEGVINISALSKRKLKTKGISELPMTVQSLNNKSQVWTPELLLPNPKKTVPSITPVTCSSSF